jgi:hypothetical protein
MNKPTREEVERWVAIKRGQTATNRTWSHVELADDYLRLLDENKKLKSWKTQAEKDLAHLIQYIYALQ